MKAEKFNYTATENMHYHCPCCAAEWQTDKLPHCPNCEVEFDYATHQEGGECYVEVRCGDELPTEDNIYYVKVRVEGTLFYAVAHYDQDTKHKWCEYLEVEDSGFNPEIWLKKKPLPQITDWDKLRDKYFEECVSGYTPKDATGFHPLGKELKSVAMAPHDLFAWFKKNLPNTQISEGEIETWMLKNRFELRQNKGYYTERVSIPNAIKAITQLMKGGEG